MIYSFQQITAIRDFLQKKQEEDGVVFKYKIVKHLNHATSIYIYDPNGQFKLDLSEIIIGVPIGLEASADQVWIGDERFFPPIDVRYITQDDYDEDKEHYDVFFADGRPSFEGVTRRLSNAFGKYAPVKEPILPPIVSFYSYKGGVGRTTTLAALASYHARRTGAKVLILDCDFEAPGLVNFFGMNEDDLASKGGIVEYLTDVAYLKDKKSVDISQYIHTISASASKDPLGYAGEKGIIHVMNAGNVSVYDIRPGGSTPSDLRSHQDHYLHGLARLDFGNPDIIVKQFQEMLLQANEVYHPDVILIDSRTGFNDILNNIVLRISDIVVGLFGTSKQNIPGLYNFLDTVNSENPSGSSFEVILINSIAPKVWESFKIFKGQIEQYNKDTGNELNPEVFAIKYDSVMAEIGTPTDGGDILLHFTDPSNRNAFPDYQNGKGERLLEFLSERIEKKNPSSNATVENEQSAQNAIIIPNGSPSTVEVRDILKPLNTFFTARNISHAENLDGEINDFLNKHYYFRNYLRDLFLRDTFIVRGYKGTGKTLLYLALQKPDFVEKLKQINNIEEDFRFVNVIDPKNPLELKSLDFKPQNTGDDVKTYYRRFWVVYIWNALIKNFSDIYQSDLPHFEVMNDEITRRGFEALIKSEKILAVEQDLRKMNEALVSRKIKVVVSFDFLDKVVEPAEWGKDFNPISQLIKFGQFNSYPSLFPKIFVRTDLFYKIQGVNNVKALENKVLSLDWTSDELFAYFFKVVYQLTGDTFINWLHLRNPGNQAYISIIQQFFEKNDAQIPLEQKDVLIFLVNNFFGEYVNANIPNFGKSYEWFYTNLKNANDEISLRPFIALLAVCLNKAARSNINEINTPILPGRYFNDKAARSSAAEVYLSEIWNEYPLLRVVLETMHKPNPRIDRFRNHSFTFDEMYMLIKTVFELDNKRIPDAEEIADIIEMLKDAGIVRFNPQYQKYPYSFAFLYKHYLGLKGNPQK